MKIFLNGRFVDAGKARVSVFDRGFLYGDGAFETMRAYDGVVFMQGAHLKRLAAALRTLRIRLPYPAGDIAGSVRRLLAVNGLRDAYIRVSVTRGEGRFGIDARHDLPPTITVVAKPFTSYPERMYEKGIGVAVVDARLNERSPVAGIKSLNFLNYIMARFEAKDRRCGEAIIMNTRGEIAEAATSNLFIVLRKRLITPRLASGALAGITRGVVLGLARLLGITAREEAVTRRALLRADEAFLTNSLFEILPVTAVDGRKVGRGAVGRVTRLLSAEYRLMARRAACAGHRLSP